MITLIHGADIASSRKFFTNLQLNVQNPIILENEQITITDLAQIFQGTGLFHDTKNVFLEQAMKKKNKEQITALITFIVNNSSEHNIYLWEGRELEKNIQSLFKQITIREFKLPQTLFLFLDSLTPNNGKKLLPLFHTTLENVDVEMIFFMIIRQFRILLYLSEPSTDKIEEIKKLGDWQKNKLETQRKCFGKEKLVNNYKKLFAMEKGQKTGMLGLPLTTAIDFFLAEL